MAYKLKKARAKGRPKSDFKVRSIRGITPKGFDPTRYEIKNGKIVFRRKKK